jgi:hypothetical protein
VVGEIDTCSKLLLTNIKIMGSIPKRQTDLANRMACSFEALNYKQRNIVVISKLFLNHYVMIGKSRYRPRPNVGQCSVDHKYLVNQNNPDENYMIIFDSWTLRHEWASFLWIGLFTTAYVTTELNRLLPIVLELCCSVSGFLIYPSILDGVR